MIISAIISPAILDNDLDDHSSNNLYNILKGIQSNGIILDNTQERYFKKIVDKIPRVANRYKQYISIIITELQKDPKRFFFSCSPSTCNDESCRNSELPLCLATNYKSDIVISLDQLEVDCEVVDLNSYTLSDTERIRIEYASNSTCFDGLGEDDKKSFWARILKYSQLLRIYDAHIGAPGFNASNFAKTLDYIIKIWRENCVYKSNLRIEITTKLKNRLSGKDIRTLMVRDILSKVDFTGISGNIYIKRDKGGLFHARYIETESRVFSCDPGFDFYDGENYRPTTVRIDEGARSKVQKYRLLYQDLRFNWPTRT